MVWRLSALTTTKKNVGILTVAIIIGLTGTGCDGTDLEKFFTNGWAVKVKEPGGLERVKKLAEKYGYENVRKIGTLDGFYHLEHPKHPSRSRRSAEDRTELLKNEKEVIWVEQQHERVRMKRGSHHEKVVERGIVPRFADPLWDEQWYLDDKRNALDLDINVIPIWRQGITGKGVVVTILDDGIEHNHTDLERNYDPAASWDVNDNDPDPFPRYDPTNENKHGTRCAGEVAAQANNTKCGVGVAFNARIGGVRMLDGRVTDRVEAESLSLNPQYIDIYSASWGPSDDGMTVEGPGTLAAAAFLNGITKGRGGLGSIYMWASGNGGRHDDSCNCDGYTASIYTLSISSSSDHGESPWYSEACSSTLATTLSSGAHGEKRIVTTDLHNQCTERHTGTSASAPLAAAIIALALEKNPKLTWRDVQHIVVHTADWLPLKHDPDWRMNGIGLHVNEKFGFGLLDAENIVNKADPKTWRTVPQKRECKGHTYNDARPLRWDRPLTIEVESDGCKGTKDEIRYTEHVQMLMTLDYSRRGDLTIHLTTPMGTRTCLLPTRSEDSSDEGFKKWIFMSTHAWGEDPRGKWTIEIKDAGDSRANTGTLREWQLILHGTKEKPLHQNITHPEIPIHRKAVPDDVKATQGNQQSSVTITKVTYTFGSNVPQHLSQVKSLSDLPTINPLNAFLSSTTPAMQQAAAAEAGELTGSVITQVPGYPQPAVDPGQSYERTNAQGQQNYNVNDYNSNSLYPYGGPRNAIYGSQNYRNYPEMYKYPSPQLNAQVSRSSSSYDYNDMRWNVPSRFNIYGWDMFGRIAKKRQIESLKTLQRNKIDLYRKTKRDILLRRLQQLRKLKQRFRT